MRVTICFGGSILNPKEIDLKVLEEIAEAIKKIREKNHEILVVTGGGNTSRTYIDAAEELGASHKTLDKIGIDATRLNARLLISALGDLAESKPPQHFEKAVRITLQNKVPVMGGTHPGHTTDAVAAELADSSNSDMLIFFTDVDGVYTSDPTKMMTLKKYFK